MPVGPIQMNCYILTVDDRAIIVDPGEEAGKIKHHITSNGLKVDAILMTHAHFDHIGALEEIHAAYPDAPVYAHAAEKEFYTNADYNFSSKAGRSPIQFDDISFITFITEAQKLTLFDREVDVYHVPGHSPGSIAYHFASDDTLIVGDALFQGSIGRTDLLFGDHAQLISGIKEKLLTLPASTLVYPGHGRATTIGDEAQTNPYLI